LPDDAPEKVLERMLDAAPEHWSSISVDRREGRPMEWEARNAVVGRLGRRHGIATPLNDAITTLLALADAVRAAPPYGGPPVAVAYTESGSEAGEARRADPAKGDARARPG
jgi:hypothetical protein